MAQKNYKMIFLLIVLVVLVHKLSSLKHQISIKNAFQRALQISHFLADSYFVGQTMRYLQRFLERIFYTDLML
jgi:hypothetical protein